MRDAVASVASRSAGPRGPLRLARGYAVLLGFTVALIVLGAAVRAHGAGLACPDWPLCFGRFVPSFDLRVGFEWAHRVLAGSIALAFAGLAIATWRDPRSRAACRVLLLGAAVLLGVQIVLGGLTVLLRLAPWTVTAHLITGNTFAVLLFVLHRRLVELARPRPAPEIGAAARGLTLVAFGLLFVQILLGGLVASGYAGLSCPEWPTCIAGAWFPTWRGPMGLHLAHRTHAYLVVACIAAAAWASRGSSGLGRVLAVATGVALLQVAVGIANVLLELPVEVTVLHSGLAAGLVLLLAHAAREAWPKRAAVRATSWSPMDTAAAGSPGRGPR